MKNKLFATLALLLLTLLAACGETTSQTQSEPAPAAESIAETQTETLAAETATQVPTEISATEPPTQETTASGSVSYTSQVKPIIDAKCAKCHGIESKKEGLDLLTYDALMAGSRNGPVITAGNANESLFVQLIIEGEMPNRGTKVTPEELQIIIDWVNQGALNN